MAIILSLYRIKVYLTLVKRYLTRFPEFLSTEKGLPLVDAWSRGLDKIHMYPDGDAKNQAVVSQEVVLTSVDGFFFQF